MENSSFWADIKKFEDTLSKDPSSYCFAPLAELYRKTGLLDDALATAQKGSAMHPEYVGGYMALGRVYLDKGMTAEALEALQRVVSYTPENMLAHKLLCQIYNELGDNERLKKSLETLLSLNPSDTESRLLLESLERLSSRAVQAESDAAVYSDFRVEFPSLADKAEGGEDLDLIDELEELPADLPMAPAPERQIMEPLDEFDEEADYAGETASSAGIRTATIAELYVSQGHFSQAIEIYRQILEDEPWHDKYSKRLAELEAMCDDSPPPFEVPPVDPWGEESWDPVDPVTLELPSGNEAIFAGLQNQGAVFTRDNDEKIAALQGWLDIIGRVRECRSRKD